MLSLRALRKAGFKKCAAWSLDDSGKPQVLGSLPPEPGVYLFVVGSKIHYVGKADDSLQKRLRRYAGAMRRDERSRPVHKGIDKELASGRCVDIYAFPQANRLHQQKGLPLDLVVGLEAGLIETLDPDWNPYNSKGRKKRASLSVPVKT